ncbi:hypothetical protein P7H46_02000, partial [Enterococcus pseudoavium]
KGFQGVFSSAKKDAGERSPTSKSIEPFYGVLKGVPVTFKQKKTPAVDLPAGVFNAILRLSWESLLNS